MERVIIALGSNVEGKLSGLQDRFSPNILEPVCFSSKDTIRFKVVDFDAPNAPIKNDFFENEQMNDYDGVPFLVLPFKQVSLKIVDAYCGFDSAVYVTSCNRLLITAFPKSGQIGRLHMLVEPTPLPSLSLFSNSSSHSIHHISQFYSQSLQEIPRLDFLSAETLISAANTHIVILSQGKLYYISDNIDGECGVQQDYANFFLYNTTMLRHVHPHLHPIYTTPFVKYWEQLQLFEPIRYVKAGFRFTIIVGTHPLTKQSCVLGVGGNLYNCINGVKWNESNPKFQIPGEVYHISALDGKSISKIVAGYGDVMYLTSNGEVYGAGYSYHGECGTGVAEELSTLQQIPFFKDKIVKDINCGTFHTLFLVQQDTGLELYVCGRNEENQLSVMRKNLSISPTRIFTTRNILTPQLVAKEELRNQIGASVACSNLKQAIGGGRSSVVIFQNNEVALAGKLFGTVEFSHSTCFSSIKLLEKYPELQFYDLKRATCGDSSFLAVFQKKNGLQEKMWNLFPKSMVLADVFIECTNI